MNNHQVPKCAYCGVELTGRARVKCAAAECKRKHAAELVRRSRKRVGRSTRPTVTAVCGVCGDTFTHRKDQGKRTRCTRCVQRAAGRASGAVRAQAASTPEAVARREMVAAAARAKSRAVRRGAVRNGEKFAPWEIHVRDGWTCWLCGCSVDPNDCSYREGKHGWRVFVAGPTYPTLDHVLPLSKGGPHTRANVRTACFVCNVRRGNRVDGAMAKEPPTC